MNCKTYEVKREQLGKKLGQTFNGVRDCNYKYLVTTYVWGEIPILIETNMTQDEFDRFADGKLTKKEISILKARDIF